MPIGDCARPSGIPATDATLARMTFGAGEASRGPNTLALIATVTAHTRGGGTVEPALMLETRATEVRA